MRTKGGVEEKRRRLKPFAEIAVVLVQDASRTRLSR
jgi:hypothetical protein